MCVSDGQRLSETAYTRHRKRGDRRDTKRVRDKVREGGKEPFVCSSGMSGITPEAPALDDFRATVMKVIAGVPCSEMLTDIEVALRPGQDTHRIQS